MALLVFVFGDNIYDRIFEKNADLIVRTNKTTQYIPDDLLGVTNDYFSKKINKPIADSLRIIKITNEGIPSKKLRIQFNLDGAIYDYKIDSSESIADSSIKGNSSIVINMDRLSQNATLEVKVWHRDDSKAFTASYSDDISSKELFYNETNKSYKSAIFFTVVFMIFIQSVLLILINLLRHMKSERKEKNERALVDRVLLEIGESLMEDEPSQAEQESKIQSSSEKDKVKERLREFVKKNTQSD